MIGLLKQRFSIVYYYYLLFSSRETNKMKFKIKKMNRIWNRVSVIEDVKKVGIELINIVENDGD